MWRKNSTDIKISVCIPFHISASFVFPKVLRTINDAMKGRRFELLISYHDSRSRKLIRKLTAELDAKLVYVEPFPTKEFWQSANHSLAINSLAVNASGGLIIFMDNDFFLSPGAIDLILDSDLSEQVLGVPYTDQIFLKKINGQIEPCQLYQNFPTLTFFVIEKQNLQRVFKGGNVSRFHSDIFNINDPGEILIDEAERDIVGIDSSIWWRDTGYNIPVDCKCHSVKGICLQLTNEIVWCSDTMNSMRLITFNNEFFGAHIENLCVKNNENQSYY